MTKKNKEVLGIILTSIVVLFIAFLVVGSCWDSFRRLDPTQDQGRHGESPPRGSDSYGF